MMGYEAQLEADTAYVTEKRKDTFMANFSKAPAGPQRDSLIDNA